MMRFGLRGVTLYRFYSGDVLLYVGISADPPVRFDTHRHLQPWWTEATRATLKHFATLAEALAAETKAIKAERLHHTVAGLPAEQVAPAWPLMRRAWKCARRRVRGRQHLICHLPRPLPACYLRFSPLPITRNAVSPWRDWPAEGWARLRPRT